MNPLYEENQSRFTEPCIVVIFGATGDLTSRKLVPALYNLLKEGQLPSQFACVGFARRPKTDEEFRKEMEEAVKKFSRTQPIDESLWKHFEDHLYYHMSEFHDDEGYAEAESAPKEPRPSPRHQRQPHFLPRDASQLFPHHLREAQKRKPHLS